MRFVHTRPFDPRQLSAPPRATALIRSEPSHLHPRQQPSLRHLRQQSLRRVWSILEMVGVGVTMAAFMAVAMF